MQGSERRYDVIDAFRGVAILSVLAFHYTVRWMPPHSASNVYGYHMSFPAQLSAGAFGVQLFFVISGLVITMTVLRSRDALEFCARRFARLYPAFLVGMALTFAVTQLGSINNFKTSVSDLLANLTMDAPDLHRAYIDGAYWSLAVEIKFYFWVATSFALFRADFWRAIAGIAIFGTICAILGHTGAADRFLVTRWMPLFLVGMGSWFLLFERGAEGRGMFLIALGSAIYVVLAIMHAQRREEIALQTVYLVATVSPMMLLLWLAPGRQVPVLAWIGRVSYSLYLIHQYAGVIVIQWLVRHGVPDIASACMAALACLATAAVMFATIEEPGKHLVMGAYARIRAMRFGYAEAER